MKTNMGSADSVIRILVAAAVIALYFGNLISGLTTIVFLVLAGIFMLTSLIRFCPLYVPFGIFTNKKKQ